MRLSSTLRIIAGLGVGLCVAVAAFAASRAPAPTGGPARLLGSYEWTDNGQPDWFGGFSALEVGAKGRTVTLLNDRSHLMQATIERRGDAIVGITPIATTFLSSSKGEPLTRRVLDSEGLAQTSNGTLYISFEGVARVARYSQAAARAQVLPRPDAFRQLPLNKALEALAIDEQGYLYTIPERHPVKGQGIAVYRWDGTKWSRPFDLKPRGKFRAVGADFGPDGRFYLLERDFSVFGFRSRLRRWTLSPIGPLHEETLLQTDFGEHDNLEGVAVWRDEKQRLRAVLVSDDNFNRFQRTEFVEYLLPD
ncbi:esterase-like activity of phytase family protein [Aliisedimentitalea scapharcae]|uniref:Esterase-like activity of phytase family protein n=1 Tax=Aliisedimentitalea scapharcae TaxID=1524259 RepID=A0ABZ2XRP3_9RHOB